MNDPANAVLLANRRRRLGVSRETMAAGIGMPVDSVKAIEDGAASGPACEDYDTWLRRIEAWPQEQRTRELLSAGKGRRFEAGTD